jgi:2-polyprenyl-6-methoxyphenol hydroxylase-like FAD-dependent oxidoreductase
VSLATRPLRVLSVGAGPAGLLYAALSCRRLPRHEVTVLERNPADATFGFGVVFSERTLDGLRGAAPETHAAIDAAAVSWEDIELRVGGERVRCGGHGFSAIARTKLLSILQAEAVEAGARLEFGVEADPAALPEADLVLGADGINSRVRDADPAFGLEVDTGAAKYIWFATPAPFDALTFIFTENEHGWWGVHAYPFDEHTSTFIVETDVATWRRAGLDAPGELPPGASDLCSLAYCEQLFAAHLGGHGLLANNSRWLNFRTLRAASWRSGRTVLLGDAAHTAHFSVGSGTKMAMEDAIGLVDAVAAADTVDAALAAYERKRRPQVEFIQRAAHPSLVWWERFRHHVGSSPERFAFHFLSRSPVITRERLLARDARFVRRVERAFATADERADVLAVPVALGALTLPSRIVAMPELVAGDGGADDLVVLGGQAAAGAGAVLASLDGEGMRTVGPLRQCAAWIHDHTSAAVGLAASGPVNAAALSAAAELAVEADVDLLLVPVAGVRPDRLPAADELLAWLRSWPVERALLLTVVAPLADGDAAAALRLMQRVAEERMLVVVVVRPTTASLENARIAQLLLCDRLRELTDVPLGLGGALGADEAATAVLAGRVDVCVARPRLGGLSWRDDVPLARADVR